MANEPRIVQDTVAQVGLKREREVQEEILNELQEIKILLTLALEALTGVSS